METENQQLKKELDQVIRVTDDYLKMKNILERQYEELVREKQVRDQIYQVRIRAIRQQEKVPLTMQDDEYPI